MLETVSSIVAGTIISIIIANCYYKKSSEDLQALVNKLSVQLDKVNEKNEILERRQRLLLDHQCQRADNESMEIVKKGSDYEGQCSKDIEGSLTVVR